MDAPRMPLRRTKIQVEKCACFYVQNLIHRNSTLRTKFFSLIDIKNKAHNNNNFPEVSLSGSNVGSVNVTIKRKKPPLPLNNYTIRR